MQTKKRQNKHLLTAAVGIASVSYVGALTGCADVDPEQDGADLPQEDDSDPDLAQASQALVVGTTATAVILKPLPASGNLMGPDTPTLPGGGVIIRYPIPVGNLMVVPLDKLQVADLAAIGVGAP